MDSRIVDVITMLTMTAFFTMVLMIVFRIWAERPNGKHRDVWIKRVDIDDQS